MDPSAPKPSPPLAPVLALVFLASVTTAVGWTGIFFVAQTVYGYTERQNLALGVALGAVYTATAFLASRIVARLRRLGARGGAPLTSRRLIGLLLAAMAALALLPPILGTQWAFWVFGVGLVVLVGLFWPAVEAYVCAGRRGRELNRATGAFNLAWSSALLPAMWAMAFLLPAAPMWVLGSLAPICLVGLVFVRRFTPEPEPHGEPLHEHPPELDAAYRRLLRLFRVSIVTSYALVQALTPVLPHLMTQLELSDAAKPVLASVWMATRLATFLLLRSWHGWHGTRLTIAAAWVLMVAGFFVALLAPGVGVLVVGLAVLGVGGGIAYAGSIYYGLEVGATDVDAGGRHEASIGLGYAIGPLALLTLGASLGLLPSS